MSTLRFNIGSRFNISSFTTLPEEDPVVTNALLKFNIGSSFNINLSTSQDADYPLGISIVGVSSFTIEPTSSHYCSAILFTALGVCSVATDNTSSILIAASDSTAEAKLGANYVCTGVNDELIVLQAAMEHVTIPGLTLKFARGKYNFASSIILQDVNIVGDGPDSTIFEFIKPETTPSTMFDVNIGLVLKTTGTIIVDGFTLSAQGTLKLIYDDPNVFYPIWAINRFLVSNINASNYMHGSNTLYHTSTVGKIMIEVAYPINSTRPDEIPRVYLDVRNCNVANTDYSGFIIYGNTLNDVYARAMKDVYFYNCHAINCGLRDDGSVVAGFNLLQNVSTENIRMQNCSANNNWHSGFYFSDAKMKLYTTGSSRTDYSSNMIYNIYMDNCSANINGIRSQGKTTVSLLSYCSGFVLREYGMGDDNVEAIPLFYSFDTYGNKLFNVPTYPAYLGDARGPYRATDPTKVAYGNIVNCTATGNLYSGFYSKGYNWNQAELTLMNCYASGSIYALVVSRHGGLKLVNFVSDGIQSPSVILNNVNNIIVDYMRIDNMPDSQYITFTDIDGYENLMLVASKYIKVMS